MGKISVPWYPAYKEACRYALKFEQSAQIKLLQSYTDIVHDAYVLWFNKTGDNLFEQHRGVISNVIKNLIWSEWGRRQYMWRGEVYQRTKIQINDNNEEEGIQFVPITKETPEDIYMNREEFERLRRNLTLEEKHILLDYMSGYSKAHVASLAGVSSTTFTKRWKIILEKLKKGLA